MSLTDIRSSNSAAMYLSLMSWITNEGRIVSDNGQVNAVLPELTPLFTGQGYTESSSAGDSGLPLAGRRFEANGDGLRVAIPGGGRCPEQSI